MPVTLGTLFKKVSLSIRSILEEAAEAEDDFDEVPAEETEEPAEAAEPEAAEPEAVPAEDAE